MEKRRISIFAPFESVQEGIERLTDIVDNCNDKNARMAGLIAIGQLVETINEEARIEFKEVEDA